MSENTFNHLDANGQARMVDVTAKAITVRSATATGFVHCPGSVVAALRSGTVPKGDVLAVARIAGIAAAKRVPELLPLAHVIGIYAVSVEVSVEDQGVRILSTVKSAERTGVEMEALTSVSVAALAVIDMIKGMDKRVSIQEIHLLAKSGGRSGEWAYNPDQP